MQNNSCRKCGNELEINKKCVTCSQPNQFLCHDCGNLTDEQIHFGCTINNYDSGLLTNN